MSRSIDISNLSSREVAKIVEEAFMQDLHDCFKEVFEELARESMKMAIKKDVYARYRATGYKRRKEDGGLLDDDNINVMVYRDSHTGNIIGYAKNTATGEGNAWELDRVIVEGVGYDWETSNIYFLQPFPRDFYKGTIERIETANWQWKVRRKLQARGWRAVGK